MVDTTGNMENETAFYSYSLPPRRGPKVPNESKTQIIILGLT